MSGEPQITHAEGCHEWGPAHYYCCLKRAAKLAVQLAAAEAKVKRLEHLYAAAQDNVRCLEQQVYGGPSK